MITPSSKSLPSSSPSPLLLAEPELAALALDDLMFEALVASLLTVPLVIASNLVFPPIETNRNFLWFSGFIRTRATLPAGVLILAESLLICLVISAHWSLSLYIDWETLSSKALSFFGVMV